MTGTRQRARSTGVPDAAVAFLRERLPEPGVMTGTALKRWGIVAVVLALVITVPAVINALPARPAALDPAGLRQRIVASADRPWSGYAESTGGLGLPRIAQLSDVTSLLTGTTRMRAWYAGPEQARVDQLSVSGERDRYTLPGGDVIWDYGATLLTVVARDPDVRLPRPDDLLPPQLARRLLAGTAADAPVSALPARSVAGVDAAGVRIGVTDPETSVEALDVWADPQTGLPVDVEVRARGVPTPLLTTTFRELEQGPPDPAALVPRRGPGAGLTRSPTSDLFGVLGRGDPRIVPSALVGRPRERPQRGFGAIGQYGRSLSQLVVVPLPPEVATTLLVGISRAGSAGRTIAVDDAGPAGQAGALQSPLLSLAVVRTAGRAWGIGGLVPPDVLDRAVADVAELGASLGGRR